MNDRSELVPDAVPVLGGAALVAAVLWGVAQRMGHPFDLEWMEGGMLAHGWRLAHGLPLYTDAGPDWVPYVYPPGYSALLAMFAPLGLDYPLGRAISIGGTLVAAAAIVRLVAMRGSVVAGLVAAACFVGCWRASGGFYDLVRPDGLAIALLGWTFVLAADRRRGTEIAAGLLLAAAFAVKHHSAAWGFALALGLWMRDGWRTGLRFGLSAAVPAGLLALYLQLRSDGRFVQYLLEVPAVHPSDPRRVLPGTPGELADWLLPAMLAGAAWLVGTVPARTLAVSRGVLFVLPGLFALTGAAVVAGLDRPNGVGLPSTGVLALAGAAVGAGLGVGIVHALAAVAARHADARWWTAFGVGGTALVVVTLMRGHNGGFMNVLMPAHLAICVGFGLAIAEARRRWPGMGVRAGTALLLAFQVAWIGAKLEIREILPTPDDRAAGERVVERLRACPEGRIFSPYGPWLAVQAGRDPGPHLIALWDVNYRTGPFPDAARSIAQAAAEHHWSCVLAAKPQALGFKIDQAYAVGEHLSLPGKAMMPKTGWRVRPAVVMVPKE